MAKRQILDLALSTGSGALGGSSLGPIGTIAGGAIGLGRGIAGAIAENKMRARNESLEAERMDRYRANLSLNSEDMYGFKPRGNNLGGYYRYGGKLGKFANGGVLNNPPKKRRKVKVRIDDEVQDLDITSSEYKSVYNNLYPYDKEEDAVVMPMLEGVTVNSQPKLQKRLDKLHNRFNNRFGKRLRSAEKRGDKKEQELLDNKRKKYIGRKLAQNLVTFNPLTVPEHEEGYTEEYAKLLAKEDALDNPWDKIVERFRREVIQTPLWKHSDKFTHPKNNARIPKSHQEWVEGFTPEERKILESTRHRRKLDPNSFWSRNIPGFRPPDEEATNEEFAYGGQLDNIDSTNKQFASGGQLDNISSNARFVRGNSHAQGGVDIGAGNEVEGGEVIVGDKVYSDSLPFGDRSFARKALELSKKQAKSEEDMMKASKKRNRYKYNAAKRLSDHTRDELDKLFEVQEEVAQEVGVQQGGSNKFAYGGNINDPFTMSPNARWDMGIDPDYSRQPFSKTFHPTFSSPIQKPFGDQFAEGVFDHTYKRDLRSSSVPTSSNFDTVSVPPVSHEYVNKPSIRDRISGMNLGDNNTSRGGSKEVLSGGGGMLGNVNSDVLSDLAPMLSDNLQAMVMNRRLRRMDIPKPSYMTPVGLDKRVDISGSMSELDAMQGSTNRGIDRGVADSSAALAMKSRTSHANVLERGKLHDYKSNLERQIMNQEKQMNMGIEERNLNAFDQHRASSFAKDIQTEISNPSANMINAIEDYKYIKDRQDAKAKDLLAMNYRNIASDGKMLDENYVSSIHNYDPNLALQYAQGNIKNENDFNRYLEVFPDGKHKERFIKWAKSKGWKINNNFKSSQLDFDDSWLKGGRENPANVDMLNTINYE